MDDLNMDMQTLCSDYQVLSVSESVDYYDMHISQLVDQRAPLNMSAFTSHPKSPWYDYSNNNFGTNLTTEISHCTGYCL